MNRRTLIAATAASAVAPMLDRLPTEAAADDIPDIHVLQPDRIELEEEAGVIKKALVGFSDLRHNPLFGQTYQFNGKPLECTRFVWGIPLPGDRLPHVAIFEEINL